MAMLTTCSNCGRLHDINDGSCQRSRPPKTSDAAAFRSTYQWTKTAKQIKERDQYLCQICIINAFDTYDQYNYKQLEVNHILPAESHEALRLEPTNLLTMCVTHHKLADRGGIPVSLMQDLAAKILTYEQVQLKYAHGEYPPTFQS